MDEHEAESRSGKESRSSMVDDFPGSNIDSQRDWANISVVDGLLARLEQQLTADGFKASIGDFIRLLEYRKKMENENVTEITVTWGGSSRTENASAE